MSGPRQAGRDALWSAMVECAERAHEMVVLGQRRASRRSAQRIAGLAAELSALAAAAAVLAGRSA